MSLRRAAVSGAAGIELVRLVQRLQRLRHALQGQRLLGAIDLQAVFRQPFLLGLGFLASGEQIGLALLGDLPQ